MKHLPTRALVALCLAISIGQTSLHAQTFWTGPSIEFCKADYADTGIVYDSLTPGVALTRGISGGFFNGLTETGWEDIGFQTADDTEWIEGTINTLPISAVFLPWRNAVNNDAKNSVGKSYVVHLISEDVYIDITINAWTQGSGGGFCYSRSTPASEGGIDMNVYGNAQEIFNGDITPRTLDQTDFGTVPNDFGIASKTFQLLNNGTSDLTISSIAVSGSDFLLGTAPAFPLVIPIGATEIFEVLYDPATIGIAVETVTIVSDDGNENPFTFDIQGESVASILWSGPTVDFCVKDFQDPSIVMDSLTPLAFLRRSGPSLISGAGPLDIQWASGQTMFFGDLSFGTWNNAIDQNNGEIGNFVAHLVAADIYIDIAITEWNTSSSEGRYCYTRSTAEVLPGTDLKVIGNAQEISNGDATPILRDHTLFRKLIPTLNLSETKTFHLYNNGDTPLDITGVSVSGSDFVVTPAASLPYSIPVGENLSFEVVFTATTIGVISELITILSTDPDENPFTFTIRGEGDDAVVWSGPSVQFCKVNYDDPIIAYDSLTPLVALTRQNSNGLYNGVSEGSHSSSSPIDTEWASGTLASFENLNFETWANAILSRRRTLPGESFVVHLITENIYFETTFDAWSRGSNNGNVGGGGFCYTRTSPNPIGGLDMILYGNGQEIVNADITPSINDNTDFRATLIADGATIPKKFHLVNNGDVPLNLTGISSSGGEFYIPAPNTFPLTIPVGGKQIIDIIFDPDNLGVITETITISTDDPDENPFTFDVQGEGLAGNIWNGLMVDFCKKGFEDPTIVEDSLTVNVSIARDFGGLFNGVTETFYQEIGVEGPADTEWARGSTAELSTLNFQSWSDVVSNGNVEEILTENYVLHLITDDIYIDLIFTSWSDTDQSGGFCYSRSTENSPVGHDLKVYGNAQEIINGDLIPELGDRTDYGVIPIDDIVSENSFHIFNNGDVPLNLTNISVSGSEFSLTNPTSFPIMVPVGGAQSLDISFDASALGPQSSLVSITSDDPDENPFTFQIKGDGSGATTYRGARINFCKEDYDDPLDPDNHDNITAGVALARGNDRGFFNAVTEIEYEEIGVQGPDDTEWALGSLAEYNALEFSSWRSSFRSLPGRAANSPGNNFVVHLITEDIYLDLLVTQWTSDENGGGFCYQRSTPDAVEMKDLAVYGNEIEISNGALSTNTADLTDFGTNTINSQLENLYTLQNNGTEDLTINAMTLEGTSCFSFNNLPALPFIISTGESILFNIRHNCSNPGEQIGTVKIYSDDPNEIPFSFNVKGITTIPNIWSGGDITFCKVDYADPLDPINQDQLTPLVSITRGNSNGFFNGITESFFEEIGDQGPADTEWAGGNTSNLSTLIFESWRDAVNSANDSAGEEFVLHLLTEDIYIDLTIDSWTSNQNGGGFCYTRSTSFGVFENGFTVEGTGEGTFGSPYAVNIKSCDGLTPVMIDLEPIVGYTWNWFPSTNLNTNSGSSVLWTPNGNQYITATGTGPNGNYVVNINALDLSMSNMTLSSVITDQTTCFPNDGAIDLNIANGAPPYFIEWSTGIKTEDLINLGGGNYSVTVTDNCGNSAEHSAIVNNNLMDSPPVVNCPADVTVLADETELGGYVALPIATYSDDNPSNIIYDETITYTWEDGDGDGIDWPFSFNVVPTSYQNDVIITLTTQGDYGGGSEYVTLFDELGNIIGTTEADDPDNDDCNDLIVSTFSISAAQFASYSVDGIVNFVADLTDSVNDFCDGVGEAQFIEINVLIDDVYPTISNSYTDNGADASAYYFVGTTQVDYLSFDNCGQLSSCSTDVTVITFDPCTDGYEGLHKLSGAQVTSERYETDQRIDSDQILSGMIDVAYDAGLDIELLPGFEVMLGVIFEAVIDGCEELEAVDDIIGKN